MNSSHLSHRKYFSSSVVSIIISTLCLIGLTWSLSGCSKKTPTPPTPTPTSLPSATPTALPPNLPPALVETDPLPGAQITLKNQFRFYFNQPMDRPSVEDAISMEPALSGSFTWLDDSSLSFTPQAALQPATSLAIDISTDAKSASGMALLEPIQLSFTTYGYLSLVQGLPAADANEVDPTSAIVAAFNQPVVALGADPSSLPAGFTLTPSVNGSGEWINTSTYIFYPQPAMSGGASYQVNINPKLTSTAGSPLESAPGWSFNTVLPRLVSAQPADNSVNVYLDTNVQLNFSYPMDAASVEANFSLQTSDGSFVTGQSSWNEDFTTFTFTPADLLQRNTTYKVSLSAEAAALGGTQLAEPISLTWNTVPELFISGSAPAEGGTKDIYEGIRLFISSHLSNDDIDKYISINPSISNLSSWMDNDQMEIFIYGSFDPEVNYTLTVTPELTDLWGSSLGQAFKLHFRTGPLNPSVQFPYNSDTTFLTTKDTGVLAQVTNISSIPISVGTMTTADLSQMFGDNGYDFRQNFTPSDAESWTFYPEVPHNESTTVEIPISADGKPRSPGLYFMRINLPDTYGYTTSLILAVSHYQTTLKLSPSEAFTWAVDMDTNTPGANLPVSVYNQAGEVLVSGVTDTSGIFQEPISAYQDPYDASYVMLGAQGEDNFGFTMSHWNEGISPWDFKVPSDFYPSGILAYVYTDRPIYRPGDTVHFRLIVRQASNGRYSLPDFSSYKLVLNDIQGMPVANFDLPLSGFGSAHGEYNLPSGVIPGTYTLINPDDYSGITFQVANYRKPEINLQVTFQGTDVISGTALLAEVNARYFFDAPAGNMPVHWVLYKLDAYFSIPNYHVGPVDTSWLDAYNYNIGIGGLGIVIKEGDGRTDRNGLLNLEIPSPANSGRQQYTLEATITDESGLPTSARNSIYVNPAEYYIGVHPDAWSFQAKSEAGFDILVTDWNGVPAGERTLSAEFQRVVWVRQDPSPDTVGYQFPTYVAEYTPIDSANITTDVDGVARLGFTPPEPGTYQLDVSGDGTLTQVIVWVGGAGQAVWPSLPNQRLRLVPDQDGYKPGDTAQVFVPNPFGTSALGLLTVERGKVMRYHLLELEPGGSTIPVALSNEDAPNVYIAVTLLGQDDQNYPDFRQGYVNLTVDASFEYLKI